MTLTRATIEPRMADSAPDLDRLETLFQAAADLDPVERGAYLDRACASDPLLRARLDELLARFDRDDSLTSSELRRRIVAVGPFPTAPPTEGPGAVIGRYKLLQVIGEGGFGVVYMAEQQEPVVRKVALKIIKLGMDTREVVARFEAERQALAMMDHPNIARVLDGGATASGRPFFVMELVRGLSITDYCDRNAVPMRQRLELFAQVCGAVQHAHQKGVVHRDLKPSNVMVTLHDGQPVPKVIDFGVAKAMHARLTDKTLFTRYEQFIGTPAYMSPEQAEMSTLDVDTRTDIYSLGVLLYELLTGTTPFDTRTLKKGGLVEMQRVIREAEPVRPSVRISTAGDAVAGHRRQDAAGLTKLLRGDLDWIVMKAIEKDRARRYGTASELADDVRRHLRNEPVVAGPPGAAYRLRKLLARNRAAVLSIALVVLALLAGMVATTVAMLDADRSAALARRQGANAVTALDFLDQTLSLADPEVALVPNMTVRSLLEHTSSRVADAFAGQPRVEARVRATIGRAYTSLGEHERAEPHLRRAVEIADEMRAAAGGDDALAVTFDDDDLYRTLWTLTNVAFHLDRSDAFAIARRARLAGLELIGASDPQLAAALGAFAQAIDDGAWSPDAGAMADVPLRFERSMGLAEAALADGDPLWLVVADLCLAAGYSVWYTPHEPLAERFWGRALEIQQRELPPGHPQIATTLGLLTGILNNRGEHGRAERLIRESVDAQRRAHPEGSLPVAMAKSMLGETLAAQGRYAEAEPILVDAHRVITEQIGDESSFLATESFIRIVRLYDAWERPEAADPYRAFLAEQCAVAPYLSPWSVARYAYGPELAELVDALQGINDACGGVSLLVTAGTVRDAEIESLVSAAILARRDLLADDDPRAAGMARLLVGWANALDPHVHRRERRTMALEAEAILRSWTPGLPVDRAEALSLLAETTPASASDHEALAAARAAWDAVRDAPVHGAWYLAAARVRIARTLLAAGLDREARALLEPAHEILVAQLSDEHANTHAAEQLLRELARRGTAP